MNKILSKVRKVSKQLRVLLSYKNKLIVFVKTLIQNPKLYRRFLLSLDHPRSIAVSRTSQKISDCEIHFAHESRQEPIIWRQSASGSVTQLYTPRLREHGACALGESPATATFLMRKLWTSSGAAFTFLARFCVPDRNIGTRLHKTGTTPGRECKECYYTFKTHVKQVIKFVRLETAYLATKYYRKKRKSFKIRIIMRKRMKNKECLDIF